ncbi:hypothetical protein KSP39_PZI022566 [Platanthera zijinensis]|uniref:Uncharacterized protein n=1 Tax=Platanthera zijinensis TaxID=2320716 RepID=A0AAP0FUE6_9ASPA
MNSAKKIGETPIRRLQYKISSPELTDYTQPDMFANTLTAFSILPFFSRFVRLFFPHR